MSSRHQNKAATAAAAAIIFVCLIVTVAGASTTDGSGGKHELAVEEAKANNPSFPDTRSPGEDHSVVKRSSHRRVFLGRKRDGSGDLEDLENMDNVEDNIAKRLPGGRFLHAKRSRPFLGKRTMAYGLDDEAENETAKRSNRKLFLGKRLVDDKLSTPEVQLSSLATGTGVEVDSDRVEEQQSELNQLIARMLRLQSLRQQEPARD